MAIWSCAVNSAGGDTTGAVQILPAVGTTCRVLEICVTFVQAQTLARVLRPFVSGTPRVRNPFEQEDEYNPSMETPAWLVTAWLEEPYLTSGTQPLLTAAGQYRRWRGAASQGQVWSFPRGLTCTRARTLVVDGVTGQFMDICVVIEA